MFKNMRSLAGRKTQEDIDVPSPAHAKTNSLGSFPLLNATRSLPELLASPLSSPTRLEGEASKEEAHKSASRRGWRRSSAGEALLTATNEAPVEKVAIVSLTSRQEILVDLPEAYYSEKFDPLSFEMKGLPCDIDEQVLEGIVQQRVAMLEVRTIHPPARHPPHTGHRHRASPSKTAQSFPASPTLQAWSVPITSHDRATLSMPPAAGEQQRMCTSSVAVRRLSRSSPARGPCARSSLPSPTPTSPPSQVLNEHLSEEVQSRSDSIVHGVYEVAGVEHDLQVSPRTRPFRLPLPGLSPSLCSPFFPISLSSP